MDAKRLHTFVIYHSLSGATEGQISICMDFNINQLCLVKSDQQEQACIDGICSFLLNEAESKEPSLAVATILSSIEDACITAPMEDKTTESDKLLAFKQYIHTIYNMYISGESIPIRIYQNTWDNYRSVLLGITDIIKPTKDGDYIKQRINSFVLRIDAAINQYLSNVEQAENEHKKGRLKYGIIGAIAVLAVALPYFLSKSSEYLMGGGFIILIVAVIVGFTTGIKIYDSRHNE